MRKVRIKSTGEEHFLTEVTIYNEYTTCIGNFKIDDIEFFDEPQPTKEIDWNQIRITLIAKGMMEGRYIDDYLVRKVDSVIAKLKNTPMP